MVDVSVGRAFRGLLLASAALICLSAAASAQDLELDAIVVDVEGEGSGAGTGQQTGGAQGETIATQAGVATKSDAPIAETPRSISVVTEQRLEDQGVQDVDEALLYVPGVYAQSFGHDTRGDFFSIRGVDAPIYLDGLRLNFGFYNKARVNPYRLGGIEVLRGPASDLYGANTTGGLVNLNSKLPQAVRANEIFAEYGTHNRKQAGFDVTGAMNADGTVLYRLIGIGRDADTQVDFTEDDSLSLTPSVTFAPNDDTRLTLLGHLQRDDGASTSRFIPIEGSLRPTPSGDFIGTDQFFGEPDFDRYDTELASLTGIFEHRFNNVFSVDARARYSDSSVAYDQIWPAFGVDYEADGRSRERTLYSARNRSRSFVGDAHLDADFQTGFIRHEAKIGIDHQDAAYDNDNFTGTFPATDLITPSYGLPIPDFERVDNPETELTQTGVYLRNRMSWNDRVFLPVALRYDTFRQDTGDPDGATDTDAVTGSVGLLYKFDNGVAPYINYSTSFEPQAPDQFGFTYSPVDGEQTEIGIKYQMPNRPVLLSAALFELTQDGRQIANPDFGPGNPAFIQAGMTRIRGAEFDLQSRFGDFEFLANFTHLDTRDEATGFELATVPRHQASAWLNYRPFEGRFKGFVAGLGVRHVGESQDGADNPANETPSYTLVDALVGWENERWSVKLTGQNLTDERYLTTCLARGDCFYGDERQISLRVSARF